MLVKPKANLSFCLKRHGYMRSSEAVRNKLKVKVKVKVIPQQAEVAHGVPGRLTPRIFLTFGTTRVVGRQP